MSLLSSVLSAEDKLPRKEKTTTQRQTDNSIRIWELLFQNLATWHERKIERPKFTTDFSILFTNGHSDRLLSNPSSAGPVTIVLEVLLLIFKITGQYLVDFCATNNLFIRNTAFQHKAIRITTLENKRAHL